MPRGREGCPPFTPTEVSLFEKGRPAPTLIKLRGGGGSAPSQGPGGCAPRIKRGGRVVHISEPATSGAQNAGEPSAHEGGKTEVQGGEAPMAGGCGGCPPTKSKGGRVAHISNLPTSGTQSASEPLAHGGGQRGWRGRSPPPGAWGCAPRIKRGGELSTLANPPRVGPKTLANPQLTRVGKRRSRGAKPPWRGAWGCPPQNLKRGQARHISNPATSGTQNAGKP